LTGPYHRIQQQYRARSKHDTVNMSYADITAKNAHQSPEEARAPAMPEVVHTEDSTSSLVDVDSPHVSSVPSDFESQSVKTDTQAARLEREEEDKKIRAKQEAEKAKSKAASKLGKGKNEVQANPVFFGNALLVGILGTVLGVGAYRKYAQGELTWKTAGIWGGVVAMFAAADVLTTGFLYKKYPPKN